jgi:hypothetical protein
MPVTSLGLLEHSGSWTLQNELLVKPGPFNPATSPAKTWVPGMEYAVFSAQFLFASPTDTMGSIVVVPGSGGGLTTGSCSTVLGPGCDMAHPPPDPVSKNMTYTFVTAASKIGSGSALNLHFNSGTFGPIGLFNSVAEATTGVIAQGAVLGQVFWVLQPTTPHATIWSAPGTMMNLMPKPSAPTIALAPVITIPVSH